MFWLLKGKFLLKITLLSSFIRPHVVLCLFFFLLWNVGTDSISHHSLSMHIFPYIEPKRWLTHPFFDSNVSFCSLLNKERKMTTHWFWKICHICSPMSCKIVWWAKAKVIMGLFWPTGLLKCFCFCIGDSLTCYKRLFMMCKIQVITDKSCWVEMFNSELFLIWKMSWTTKTLTI